MPYSLDSGPWNALVFKAHRLLYYSTLGSSLIKKQKYKKKKKQKTTKRFHSQHSTLISSQDRLMNPNLERYPNLEINVGTLISKQDRLMNDEEVS